MTITMNGKKLETPEDITLGCLRDTVKPGADVLVLNGFPAKPETVVRPGDEVVLITRGEVPSAEELEELMAARHTPGVHERMKHAVVGIAGLGGLGSHIAMSLARMGVGALVLVDFDVVEPTNLNRQYYFIDQLGMPKTDALVTTLMRANPYLDYRPHHLFVTEENAGTVFAGCDVVIEAFDVAETKAMFIRTAMNAYPDSCIIGASGVAGVHDTASLGVRKLGRRTFIVGDFLAEARQGEGLMAPRVTAAANIQANIAVRWLLGLMDQ